MTLQTPAPGKRIEIIDVLRGFALFGIALIHMIEQYYAGQPPEGVGQHTLADNITEGFGFLFIMGKFFMIFSFLFGLSFHIQLSKNNEQGSFLARFAWRLIILFAIGMLHHLHYRGDILTIYAILGFALLLFYRLPDKALLIVALILVLNIPAFITRTVEIFYPVEWSIMNQDPAALKAYYETVKHGSYFDILKANFHEFGTKMEYQLWSGRIYITLGLFLLGLYAGRKRFFENIPEKIALLKKFRNYAWLGVGASLLMAVSLGVVTQVIKVQLSNATMLAVGMSAMDIFNTSLFVVYVVVIMMLFQRPRWHNALMVLYPVGKMGLTVYLLQAFFGTMIFFSYGLGLIYELGSFYSLLLGLGVFVVEIVIAHVWLRYFTYGPVEWIWRNLTYFKIQKLTITEARSAA